MSRDQLFAVIALAAIVVITVAWWMLALWPVPAEGAQWVLRTREVCFGSTASGLPAPEGWALLIGQPLTMTAVLFIGWWRPTIEALRTLARSTIGRAAGAAAVLLLASGAVAASVRVANATEAARLTLDPPARAAADLPRLDRPAPPLELVDQRGDDFSLDQLRGQPVLVTFAFAHCETVCPTLVRDVRSAGAGAANAANAANAAVVVVTVDPWRDTPARLPAIAAGWDLGDDEWILSGPIDDVRSTLEAWEVSIARDRRTGDIVHPALVYIIDSAGRLAFATTGGGSHAVELLARLD